MHTQRNVCALVLMTEQVNLCVTALARHHRPKARKTACCVCAYLASDTGATTATLLTVHVKLRVLPQQTVMALYFGCPLTTVSSPAWRVGDLAGRRPGVDGKAGRAGDGELEREAAEDVEGESRTEGSASLRMEWAHKRCHRHYMLD